MNEMEESINAGIAELVERVKQMPGTDPAEYFRRQPDWFRRTPESEKLLRQERQRLAVTESWWGIRFRIAKLLRRMADRIYREGWGSD